MKPLPQKSVASPAMKTAEFSIEKDRLQDILASLRQGHRYYMDVMVPSLAASLERMTAPCGEHQRQMFWKFFSDYKEELLNHFSYEENIVFPYIEEMLNDERSGQYSIGEYEQNHSNVQEKLDDLKNLITKYLPTECRQEDVNQVLNDLYALELDLRKHTFIEDDVLIPAARQLEQRVAVTKEESEELSAREKEILVCVAKGMLNKEIADHCNISIYTVITHRKNITRKTGIKTVAGLTVYALLNNLIDMNTIE
ncbi:MAG: hemerythrin domain-containing protein [Bacteroidales bacterium]|nr:hemerythrin domain-containing protein [Bacteroidales bacterium]